MPSHILQNTFLGLMCIAMAMIGFSAGVLISDNLHSGTIQHAEALEKGVNYTGDTSTQMLVPWTEEMEYDLDEMPLNKT